MIHELEFFWFIINETMRGIQLCVVTLATSATWMSIFYFYAPFKEKQTYTMFVNFNTSIFLPSPYISKLLKSTVTSSSRDCMDHRSKSQSLGVYCIPTPSTYVGLFPWKISLPLI